MIIHGVCDECEGEKSVQDSVSVPCCGILLSNIMLARLSALPDVQLYIDGPTETPQPIPFRFNGGTGYVMPLLSEPTMRECKPDPEPERYMEGMEPLEQAYRAIGHALSRVRDNWQIGYHAGDGTEMFDLLCEAMSTLSGKTIADIREIYAPSRIDTSLPSKADTEIVADVLYAVSEFQCSDDVANNLKQAVIRIIMEGRSPSK